MRLKYMFANKKKTKPHPFHVKSNWQPPPQPSVALETYLEETKLEIASTVFCPQPDNISAGERAAINALKKNSELNLKKADKGTTLVILNTTQKIEEGLQQLSDDKFYKPLPPPIVVETARKVQNFVFDLYRSGHIDLQMVIKEVRFSDRQEALRSKPKRRNECLPFVTTFNPAVPNL